MTHVALPCFFLQQILQGRFSFDDAYFDGVSPAAKDLIQRLLTVDPKKRLTAAEALRHQWIQATDESLEERDLTLTKKRLRARRRFRAAVQAVRILNRLHHHQPFGASSSLPGAAHQKD